MAQRPSKRGHSPDLADDVPVKRLKSDANHRNGTVSKSPPGSNDYTIGWICTVPEDFTAAILMLDENFGFFQGQPSTDKNTYRLGRMKEHNIVIACLPERGAVPATAVAKDMLRTFGSLKIGVSVGIADGIPSKDDDIRVGDVVVSHPDSSFSGVVPWDSTKILEGKKPKLNRSLNKPPPILLTALRAVRAYRLLDSIEISSTINRILEKKQHLRRNTFCQQDPKGDTLDSAKCASHEKLDAACSVCSEIADLPFGRKPRLSTDPTIHYGIIASGNTCRIDKRLRLVLKEWLGAKCVDTEAAGLMDYFPCLAIRGIGGYSGTHKNRSWQQYAALTAAAYSKQLLICLPPQRVAQTPETVELKVEALSSSVARLEEAVEKMTENNRLIIQHFQEQRDLGQRH